MKIGFALHHNTNNSPIHEHFGRCPWFGFYDSETGILRFKENEELELPGHAGLRVAEMVMKEGVELVVAGRFGANVMDFLEKNKIRMVVTELPRTLDDFIARLKK